MKRPIILLFAAVIGVCQSFSQTCSTCGKVNADSAANTALGFAYSMSMGAAQFGQSAGNLAFSGASPDPILYTPAALYFTGLTRTDVDVIYTNLVVTNTIITTNITFEEFTNVSYMTNSFIAGTNTFTFYLTNIFYDQVYVTNIASVQTNITEQCIRQVESPEALADIPVPVSTNGYSINFYYASQITGVNSDGTYAVSGSPFITWVVTNPSPSSIYQIQVSQFGVANGYGLMKQWTNSYDPSTGGWSVQNLGGVQKKMWSVNVGPNVNEIINTLQYAGGPVVQQVATIYTNASWGSAPIEKDTGSSAAPEQTLYTYNGSGQIQSVLNPDGSWEYHYDYYTNGYPKTVYSSFEDTALANYSNGKETVYTYNPTNAGVSISGDDGTVNPNVPRLTIVYLQSQEISRSYTVFPSVYSRLDIQCTAAGAAWNAAGNLVTTNLFYTSGLNQFALQTVIRPDRTMTTYSYSYTTNGPCRTNITVTGQPDPTYSYIVDGVSNVIVLNISGYKMTEVNYDVFSGLTLSRDVYTNFDSYGRPQLVTHLDGTSNVTQYACCGLYLTVNADGLTTQYLYDSAKRQVGYQKVYGTSPITYSNVLDAAGRTLQSIRIGTDNSPITMRQSGFDLAGELIAQTNALGGATVYSRTNDPTTGGLIRTRTYPNGGTRIDTYYADGTLKSVTGTAVHGKACGYGAGNDVNGNACTYFVETNLNADGSLSSEWTKTYTDMAGRMTEVLYADGHYSQSFYNSNGQLWKQVDPDGVITLNQYNAKGEQAYSAIDMNQNGSIDFSGADRIKQTTNDVTTDHSTTVRRTRSYVWLDGQSTGTLVFQTETSADGLNSWRTQYRDTATPVTAHSQTVPGISRTMTNTAPDGSYIVNTYSYGLLASSTRHDSTGTQIGGTTYGYDAHARQYQVTDARNGTTTLGFNSADLVATNTTPNPGGGSPEVTQTAYDTMLRPTTVTQPDSTTVTSVYLLTGELGLQYGSRTYPVAYSYDYAGRMQYMTNWSGYPSTGARVTTWNYDANRGFLSSKTYDGGTVGPSYTYTSAGRLASRTWARGITTSYGYDNGGGLNSVSYSDITPGITYTNDRLGRQSSATVNGMTDTMTYNLANELLSESFTEGILNNLSVTNTYDSYLRRTALAALSGASQLLSDAYSYDNASRLSGGSDGNNNSATYNYLANSPLVSQITFKQSGSTRMTKTNRYDYLNRLTQVSSTPSAGYTLPLTYNYNYNPANQRTKDTLADGSYWNYGYDSLGQVTNGCKFFTDGTPVAGQQFDYAFDTIGNRTQTKSGGDQTGANLRVANYTNNTLNQITSRDVPPYVDVMGASILSNAVTVAGQTAYRKQEYFRQQISANNSGTALWTNIIVSGGQNVTGSVYVAMQPEVFQYDPDGNLTNDGRWAYVWDGENRLVQMTVNTNIGPQYQMNFAYDAKGRRIQKMVSTNGVGIYTNRFLYDGWNLIAELNPGGSLIRSYVWGTDLSATMQGACGVGGLLEVSYYGSSTTNGFPAFDGNGNIMALINAADGTLVANYDYGPFGEVIRTTGPVAKVNPLRFSTKYDDDESDLLYYGYRFYKPATGTWPNRDLINEIGFCLTYRNSYQFKQNGEKNLYGFVANQPINAVDKLGLRLCICFLVCKQCGLNWLSWPPPSVIFGEAGPNITQSDVDKCCNLAAEIYCTTGIGSPATGRAIAMSEYEACILIPSHPFW